MQYKKQKISLLSTSIATICAAIALPAMAVKDSPFSTVPSYLEQLTTTTKVSQTATIHKKGSEQFIEAQEYKGFSIQEKQTINQKGTTTTTCTAENNNNNSCGARVVLAFDTSGSMRANDKFKNLKNATKIITDKYNSQFEWQFLPYLNFSGSVSTDNDLSLCQQNIAHGHTGDKNAVAVTGKTTAFLTGKAAYAELEKTCPYGQTLTTVNYIAAVDTLYRTANKNNLPEFIIVFSDGDVNNEAWAQTADGDGLYGVYWGKIPHGLSGYGWIYDGKGCVADDSSCLAHMLANSNTLMGARPYMSSIIAWKNPELKELFELVERPFPTAAYINGKTYGNYKPPESDWNHLPEEYMYFAPTIDANGGYTYLDTTPIHYTKEGTFRGNCSYDAISNPDYAYGSVTRCKTQSSPRMMSNGKQLLQGIEYFSDKLFNNHKRKIQTITVAYNGNLSANGRAYLKQAARVDERLKNPKNGTGYYEVNNGTELSDALSKIADGICSVTASSAISMQSNNDASPADSNVTPISVSITPPTAISKKDVPIATRDTTGSQPVSEDTVKTERLRTTSVAAPANISSQSIDVSEFPAQNRISQVTTDKDGNTVIEEVEKELCKGLSTDGSCANQVGLMSTLSLNTANWSSLLKFQQIYTVEAPFNKFPLKDSKKYSCSLIEGSQLSSDANGRGKWLCTNSDDELNDKQGTANFPSPYKIVVSSENGKGALLDNSYFSAFGFNKEDGGDVEFEKGFLPWITRAGSGENADVEIEEAVAAANIANRLVAKYRNRVVDKSFTKERNMADVIDAAPISLSAAKELNGDNKNIDRAKYLVMGANDGMLYVYQRASNITNPYELKFTYMPYQMPREKDETLAETLPNTIARASYGETENQHIYGVNGGISYMTTATVSDGESNKRNQQTVLLANLGQGGRGVFSLNANGQSATANVGSSANIGWEKSITDAANWEAKNGDEEINLGYTISNPVLAYTQNAWGTDKVKDKDGNETDIKYAKATEGLMRVSAFVANGFPTGAKCPTAEQSSQDPADPNNPTDPNTGASQASNGECDTTARDNQDEAPSLYIFDALGINFNLADNLARREGTKAGDLIKKITVSDYTANKYAINALGSPVVVDLDFDGIADVAYAGDYNGDLYRFDLRGDSKAWNAKKIFHGTNPITAAPAVYRPSDFNGNKLIVLFGTGSDIYKEDRTATEPQQRFYGIYDDLLDQKPTVLEESDLAERNFITKANKERSLPDASKEDVKYGWYIPLASGGESVSNGLTASSERVVTQPVVVLDGVFFTTRKYHFQDGTSETSTSYAPETEPQYSDEQCSAWEKHGEESTKLIGYEIDGVEHKFSEEERQKYVTIDTNGLEILNDAAADIGWSKEETSGWEKQLCPDNSTQSSPVNSQDSCVVENSILCQTSTQTRKLIYQVIEPEQTRSCEQTATTESEQTTTTTELTTTTGSSYLMGVNVFTGGNLTNASVKFRSEYDAASDKNTSEGDGEVSGVYYNSIASAPSVLAVHQALDTIKNTDQNGAILSGEAEVMSLSGNAIDGGAKLKTNVQNNKCLAGQDWAIYLSTSGTPDDGSGNLQQKSLQVKNCGGAFLRASIREIKLNRK
ncbi:MAG: hypothetical protein J6M05_01850 [Cardiobacteriaceae bacterium]|nr:hypothetical protein [Cardiobacteriaceae bacterium]